MCLNKLVYLRFRPFFKIYLTRRLVFAKKYFKIKIILKQKIYILFKRKRVRPIWLVCLRTPTCVQFTPSVWPLCPRTFNWPDVFEESALKFTLANWKTNKNACFNPQKIFFYDLYFKYMKKWLIFFCYLHPSTI